MTQDSQGQAGAEFGISDAAFEAVLDVISDNFEEMPGSEFHLRHVVNAIANIVLADAHSCEGSRSSKKSGREHASGPT